MTQMNLKKKYECFEMKTKQSHNTPMGERWLMISKAKKPKKKIMTDKHTTKNFSVGKLTEKTNIKQKYHISSIQLINKKLHKKCRGCSWQY